MNLVEYVKDKAAAFGDKEFLLGEGGPITYRELDRSTDRMAMSLAGLGIGHGDRVAVLHPNSPYLFQAYLAIVKAGAAAVPVNPIYTPREIAHILNDSGARMLVAHGGLAHKAGEIAEPLTALSATLTREPDQSMEEALAVAAGGKTADLPLGLASEDRAFIFYTSGTTGKPKGVVLSHRNLYFGGANIAQNFGLRPGDRALAVLPMVHIFCIASPFMGSLSSGGSVVVLPSFNTEAVLSALGEHRITWFPGVPTMFSYLLNNLDPARHDVSALRMGLSGGAPMPMDLMDRWTAAFGATVQEAYGLTESTGLVICDPVFGQRKPGSIGIVASGVEARLVDEQGNETPQGRVGHLIFRGPNRTAGYHNLPEVTAERVKDGWLYTGDHAWRDEEGFYFIAGREQELIITGGYNVYPREIEEVLYAFPGVNEAAVIGAPDPNKGETPRAFISLKEGVVAGEAEILAHCKRNLAPYKMPQIRFLPELPKNPTGKILKSQLPAE